MTTFTLPADALRSIATLHNATPADKAARDMTPILTAIQLTVTPAEWRAVATDRYVVAELTGDMGDYAHTLPMDGTETTVLIRSTDLVDYVKRMGARSSLPVMVTISDDGAEIELNNYDVRSGYRTVTGNFPPVARLFPEESAFTDLGAIGIDPNKLARLGKILMPFEVAMRPADRSSLPTYIRFTEQGDRPGPVLVTRGPSATGYRALLQPVLIRN